MSEPRISVEALKAQMLYDPETGIFSWLRAPSVPAGSLTTTGYWQIRVERRMYAAHRLAWLYMTGEYPEKELDHINGKRADNRFSNLRIAPERSLNMANQRLLKRNTTGAKGVALTRSKTYRVQVYFRRKSYHGGCFETLDEAAHAYNKLAIHHFGDFAVLNPIGVDK